MLGTNKENDDISTLQVNRASSDKGLDNASIGVEHGPNEHIRVGDGSGAGVSDRAPASCIEDDLPEIPASDDGAIHSIANGVGEGVGRTGSQVAPTTVQLQAEGMKVKAAKGFELARRFDSKLKV